METSIPPDRVQRWEAAVLAFLAGVLVGLLVMSRHQLFDFPASSDGPIRGVGVVVEHDTVRVAVAGPRINVTSPARVRVIRDTLIRYIDTLGTGDTIIAPLFAAQADTVLGRDTIRMQFDYPPPRLSLELRAMADTLTVPVETTTITQQIGTTWYEQVGMIGGGAVIGYVLRMVTEPRR